MMLSLLLTLGPAAQAATLVQVDLARVVYVLAVAIFSALSAIVIYFLKGMLDEFRSSKKTITTIASDLQSVRQELFGVTGNNGMRRDLRRTRELQVKHDRVLVKLAEHAGIEVDFDEEAA